MTVPATTIVATAAKRPMNNDTCMSMQIAMSCTKSKNQSTRTLDTHNGLGSTRNVQTGMIRRRTDPVSVHMFSQNSDVYEKKSNVKTKSCMMPTNRTT